MYFFFIICLSFLLAYSLLALVDSFWTNFWWLWVPLFFSSSTVSCCKMPFIIFIPIDYCYWLYLPGPGFSYKVFENPGKPYWSSFFVLETLQPQCGACFLVRSTCGSYWPGPTVLGPSTSTAWLGFFGDALNLISARSSSSLSISLRNSESTLDLRAFFFYFDDFCLVALPFEAPRSAVPSWLSPDR